MFIRFLSYYISKFFENIWEKFTKFLPNSQKYK
jgi:hypothetical protein